MKESLPVGAAMPLSAAQREIWNACRDDPGTRSFNVASYLEVRGQVDRNSVQDALRQAVAEAEALRARFSVADGEPRQSVRPATDWDLPLVDLDSEGDQEATARAWMRQRLQRTYEPALGTLFDFALLCLATDHWIVYLGYHLLVLDVAGINLVIKRTADIYRALVAGEPVGPSPFGAFRDLLAEESAYLGSADFAEAHQYFAERLAAWPDWVSRVNETDAVSSEVARCTFRLSATETHRLRARCGTAGVGLLESLVSVLGVYLARMRGTQDTVIGIALDGRGTALSRTVPTSVANVLPVRLLIPARATWAQLGIRVGADIDRLIKYQRYRGEYARPGTGQRHGVSFCGAVVSVQPGVAVDFGPSRGVVRHLATMPVADVVLHCEPEDDGGVTVSLDARLGHRHDAGLDDHGQRIAGLFATAAARPDSTVHDAELLTDRDRARVLNEWNDTVVPLPDLSVPAVFGRQAAKTPGAIAVEMGSKTVSYAELSTRASRLAGHLADHGVVPGDTVAVLLRRSVDLVVALLAVVEAGAAYVPLDPRDPVPRMHAILAGAGPSFILVDAAMREHEVAIGRRVLFADSAETAEEPGTAHFPGAASNPHGLLYVMHTSGSTGKPKGVAVTHRNVIALALDRIWCGGTHQRVLLHSPHAFDASTYELWVPLLSGGTVVISGEEIDAVMLRKLASSGRITALWLTAGLFGALAEGDPACLDGVRQVWTGGDVVSPRAVERIARACRDITIFNGYGPTETTTFATRYRIYPGSPATGSVPIGTPMDNTRVYVLDEELRLRPPGAVGQMYIAGEGVACGYVNRPDLTAERFVPDPFGVPGTRMYVTGDLACWEPTGNLRFLGRADRQVKINGFRIEAGEIEAVLAGHPQVSQAAVTVHKSRDGSGRISAYAVPTEPGLTPDGELLRDYLAERLPEYMVPAQVSFCAELPLTPNGKVDRRALPAPSNELPTATGAPVLSGTERLVVTAMQEVLDIAEIGPHDNFFRIGGNSIAAVRVAMRLSRETGARITPQLVFRAKTASAIAERLAAWSPDKDAATQVARKEE